MWAPQAKSTMCFEHDWPLLYSLPPVEESDEEGGGMGAGKERTKSHNLVFSISFFSSCFLSSMVYVYPSCVDELHAPFAWIGVVMTVGPDRCVLSTSLIRENINMLMSSFCSHLRMPSQTNQCCHLMTTRKSGLRPAVPE